MGSIKTTMSGHFTKFNLAILPLTISAILVGMPVLADETNRKGADVESIIVVGATTNTEITKEQLANYQANDLADVFRQVPAVTVGGSLGIAQKIYVRGLEDSMVNVTVDGAPQTSTLFHHTGNLRRTIFSIYKSKRDANRKSRANRKL